MKEVPFLNARIIGQKYLNVSEIKIGWMPRGIDPEYVELLAEVLRSGRKFPEDVQVFEDNELTDGLHRTEGYKKVETITIPVLIWNCPKENRTALKIYLNSLHGKQLSPKEKQESYMSLLKENPSIKDNSAALILGVSERTIQRWKPEALKQKRLSQEEVQKIQELKEEGKTQREIAEEIGISEAAISKNLTSDKCQKLSSTPSYLEPDDDKALPISEVLGKNIIKAPVEFKKPPEVSDDDEDLDETDDLNIETDDPGMITVKPVNWKEKGNKFVEAMITASAFEKALEIDANGGFPDNMKEIFAEAILLMQRNLPRYLEYFMTTNSIERR